MKTHTLKGKLMGILFITLVFILMWIGALLS